MPVMPEQETATGVTLPNAVKNISLYAISLALRPLYKALNVVQSVLAAGILRLAAMLPLLSLLFFTKELGENVCNCYFLFAREAYWSKLPHHIADHSPQEKNTYNVQYLATSTVSRCSLLVHPAADQWKPFRWEHCLMAYRLLTPSTCMQRGAFWSLRASLRLRALACSSYKCFWHVSTS